VDAKKKITLIAFRFANTLHEHRLLFRLPKHVDFTCNLAVCTPPLHHDPSIRRHKLSPTGHPPGSRHAPLSHFLHQPVSQVDLTDTTKYMNAHTLHLALISRL